MSGTIYKSSGTVKMVANTAAGNGFITDDGGFEVRYSGTPGLVNGQRVNYYWGTNPYTGAREVSFFE